MLQILLDFAKANEGILIVLLINELLAASPKFFSGSIGQLILNLVRGAFGAAPVSIPAPTKAP